jgi:hypothetical protein
MELDPSFELGPKVLEFKKIKSRIGIKKFINESTRLKPHMENLQ